MSEDDGRIAQLQAQQSLLTQALIAALEGNWTGAPPSVEAFLYAIDPNLQGTIEPDPPVSGSEFVQPPKG